MPATPQPVNLTERLSMFSGHWLFEPASTLNPGNVRDERTVDRPARL